ncbi:MULTISPECIES: DUF881 domain-containing protein [Actinomadura]|uniref:DUF881 domain-containing protein n=1 Tax=Actinomadura litoris TaxID=2678616 RepID=A0A7K1KZ85_9ACTN|nr:MULTISPECIES: DUF881 domain-containing protein [Actinomadura]MBT2212242.1 DUF881 domain-containing protein [Actinomadura sp. NEAU-AAG7]MUN37266.1 DUF881 domain-containing protein [Actinomadura litoris]
MTAPGEDPAPEASGGQSPADEGSRRSSAPPSEAPKGVGGVLDLLRPRVSWGQLAGGLLCLLLGFAVVAQVQANKRDTTFATARQDELVGILSDLGQRSERLRGDLRDLEETKAGLERDAQGGTALEEARRRATTYGLLAGTLPAEGPGVEVAIDDRRHGVRALHLLDALQELRDAGAEVIQVNEVRAGVDTYFLDEQDGVQADGRLLQAPYRFLAIGDPHTMATALNIPGGVVKTLQGAGAVVSITPRARIAVRAIRSP